MNKFFTSLLIVLSSHFIFAQNKEDKRSNIGLNIDYAYWSSSHSVVIGPMFFLNTENRDSHLIQDFLSVNFGLSWINGNKPLTSTSLVYYTGYIPGFMAGIASHQYYNSTNKSGERSIDLRMGPEIIFAFFGFVGYRYQHPVVMRNENPYIARHSLFIRIPIEL